MSPIWIVSMILQWLVLAGLCLLVLSMVRQFGVLTLRINSMGSGGGEGPTVYTNIPKHTVPLMDGGAFVLGGEKPQPTLVSFYSPGCGPCAGMEEEIMNVANAYSRDDLSILVVLTTKRSEVEAYLKQTTEDGRKRLEGLAVAAREDFPEQYVPMVSGPYSFMMSPEGVVAARGKPRTFGAFKTMIYAARNMADPGTPGSMRIHDWGESAPYWELDGGPNGSEPAEANAASKS